jgi:hypothetical protein
LPEPATGIRRSVAFSLAVPVPILGSDSVELLVRRSPNIYVSFNALTDDSRVVMARPEPAN